MDEVDRKQQEEIHALQKRDVRHDRELHWFKVIGFLIVTWTIVSTVVVLEAMRIRGPYMCPHPDCVHNRSSDHEK